MGENASRFANKYLLSIGPCDSTAYHSGSPETSAKAPAKQIQLFHPFLLRYPLTHYKLHNLHIWMHIFAALPDIPSIELPAPQLPAPDILDQEAGSQAIKAPRSFDIMVSALEPSKGKR
jgi:hypothetical protein